MSSPVNLPPGLPPDIGRDALNNNLNRGGGGGPGCTMLLIAMLVPMSGLAELLLQQIS